MRFSWRTCSRRWEAAFASRRHCSPSSPTMSAILTPYFVVAFLPEIEELTGACKTSWRTLRAPSVSFDVGDCTRRISKASKACLYVRFHDGLRYNLLLRTPMLASCLFLRGGTDCFLRRFCGEGATVLEPPPFALQRLTARLFNTLSWMRKILLSAARCSLRSVVGVETVSVPSIKSEATGERRRFLPSVEGRSSS